MRQPDDPTADTLQRGADRIAALILYSDLPEEDIALEIAALREVCEREAPDRAELFEAVYVGRFRRLWEQWRQVGE
jgi:hypothetical protein